MSSVKDFIGINCYILLGVTQTCTESELAKGFRKAAFTVHPDRNHDVTAKEEFQILNNAHDILQDPDKRKAYDSHNAGLLERAFGRQTSNTRATPASHFYGTDAFFPTKPKPNPKGEKKYGKADDAWAGSRQQPQKDRASTSGYNSNSKTKRMDRAKTDQKRGPCMSYQWKPSPPPSMNHGPAAQRNHADLFGEHAKKPKCRRSSPTTGEAEADQTSGDKEPRIYKYSSGGQNLHTTTYKIFREEEAIPKPRTKKERTKEKQKLYEQRVAERNQKDAVQYQLGTAKRMAARASVLLTSAPTKESRGPSPKVRVSPKVQIALEKRSMQREKWLLERARRAIIRQEEMAINRVAKIEGRGAKWVLEQEIEMMSDEDYLEYWCYEYGVNEDDTGYSMEEPPFSLKLPEQRGHLRMLFRGLGEIIALDDVHRFRQLGISTETFERGARLGGGSLLLSCDQNPNLILPPSAEMFGGWKFIVPAEFVHNSKVIGPREIGYICNDSDDSGPILEIEEAHANREIAKAVVPTTTKKNKYGRKTWVSVLLTPAIYEPVVQTEARNSRTNARNLRISGAKEWGEYGNEGAGDSEEWDAGNEAAGEWDEGDWDDFREDTI